MGNYICANVPDSNRVSIILFVEGFGCGLSLERLSVEHPNNVPGAIQVFGATVNSSIVSQLLDSYGN